MFLSSKRGVAMIFSFLKLIKEGLCVPKSNPLMNVAQFEALSKQVPLLYFILMVNMLTLAWTHIGVAPGWLVMSAPILLGVFSLVRAIKWIKWRGRQISPEAAYRDLRVTNFLAAPLAIGMTAWSLALLPYGDAYQRAHVAFFMSITVIGIIFCLMHLRSAALMVAIIVNVPFMVAMLISGHSTFVATGVNVALVTGALIVVVTTHYRDFQQLNESRIVLLEQQKTLTQLSDENLRLANLDSLTGLPNRRSFFDRLKKGFAEAERLDQRIAVGVLDLDGFKPINDMHGHAAGDKVLVKIARRLMALESEGVSFFRLGGDEFAMICDRDCDEVSLAALGEKICSAVAEKMQIGTGSLQVTGSMGIAVFPDVGLDGQELYERADYALYAAKRDQRAGVVLFNAVQAKSLGRQKEVEEALLTADLERELSLEYQPIYDIEKQRCIGFEALARWTSGSLGRVSPGEFIPIAEHSGRIALMTRMLLRKALAQASEWPAGTLLSFNLSPIDLVSSDSIVKLIAIVETSSFDPRFLNFEITESAVIRDFEQATRSIALLKQLGVGISLDDFGTGYSSLSHVHKLPLSKIKIDQSFVRNVHQRPASAKIIRTMLSLCGELGLGSIIEGVETIDELDALADMGVKFVQGYHFSRPLPFDSALQLIREQRHSEQAAAVPAKAVNSPV